MIHADNSLMFVREKTARGHTYLYLVESLREGGRVRQRTIRALGRKDALLANGELDRLIASLARHSERAMILSGIMLRPESLIPNRKKTPLITRLSCKSDYFIDAKKQCPSAPYKNFTGNNLGPTTQTTIASRQSFVHFLRLRGSN